MFCGRINCCFKTTILKYYLFQKRLYEKRMFYTKTIQQRRNGHKQNLFKNGIQKTSKTRKRTQRILQKKTFNMQKDLKW